MSRLRVLHVGKYYPPDRGGIETVLEAVCRGTADDIVSTALVLNREGRTVHETVDGVAVTRVASLATVGAVSVTPTLPLWLSRQDPDVVVMHEPNPMALVACVVARPSRPIIVWFHSEAVRAAWQYRLFYHPPLDWVLSRAARIIVSAPAMRDAAPLARHRQKVTVVPYGLDPDSFPETTRQSSASTPTVLFVGRLVAYKGVDVLLRAMADVPASLVLVGDGPLRAALEQTASDLGMRDRVRFLGRVSDAERQAWYQRADVLALPSVTRQEAFGMVQVEAMLNRLPVVSTDLPTGVPWVNLHGESGLVVPPLDVAALAKALRSLCADADLRARLGAGGRGRALRHFTARRMCAEFAAVCRDVAAAVDYLPAPAVQARS